MNVVLLEYQRRPETNGSISTASQEDTCQRKRMVIHGNYIGVTYDMKQPGLQLTITSVVNESIDYFSN